MCATKNAARKEEKSIIFSDPCRFIIEIPVFPEESK